MSIDKVEVTNAQGAVLTLTLDDISNGYVVEDIDGLGPVKASIASSNFAGLDGVQYQASRREGRNVTMKLGFAPNYSINQTVRSLRTNLYRFFMTNVVVTLTFFMEDGLVVTTAGRVETCEPSLFTAEPQMDISMLCPDPDFVDTVVTQIHDELTTSDDEPFVFDVGGTVNTGISMLTFIAPEAIDEFTIYHTTPSGDVWSMLVASALEVNDEVRITTIPGQKTITLIRSGVTSSLLYAVSPQSKWPLLEPGENGLYLNAGTVIDAPVLLDFYNRYGGL